MELENCQNRHKKNTISIVKTRNYDKNINSENSPQKEMSTYKKQNIEISFSDINYRVPLGFQKGT